MKIIVAVIVFNRPQNIKKWLACWQQCNTENAELIIIHNDNGESEKFKAACDEAGIRYIRRVNIGMDIGAFQDVCRERLKDFPNDWDYLLWCTDDTFPMSKDFISPFIETLQRPDVGVSCMQISKSKPGNIWHVRTTGFCITKQMSRNLRFLVDPIRTRQDCYSFEHRGKEKTISEQIRHMGLSCVQVRPNATSPLWDSGYWKRLDRQDEHDKLFGFQKKEGDRVVFVATIYNSYPQIISSLLLQTHQNWELILIHDGPASDSLKSWIGNDADPRIKFIETKERVGNWGHSYRQMALREFDLGDYVVITNADNYYCPTFIEYLLRGFKKSHTAVAAYCDSMTHSYKAWQVLPVRFEKGFIDCGGVMVKSNIAKEVGWRIIDEHSADWTYFSDIAAKYSPRNFVSVKGNLFVHN